MASTGERQLADVDHLEIYIGVRGTGKSTLALADAIALQRERPTYVLAHDAQLRIPATWPDGQPTPLKRSRTIADLRSALKTAPSVVHSVATTSADELVSYARSLSEEIKRTWQGDPQKAPIVLVMIDEGVNLDGAGPYRLDGTIRKLLAGMRHERIALKITIQNPQFLHYSTYALATRLVLLRVTHRKGLKALEDAGVDDATIAQLPKLPNYKAIPAKL